MNIYLVGYMYSGKTTFGRQLAERLGYHFADLDTMFENKVRTSIPVFFAHYGEQAFRIIEQKVLHSTTELDNHVIATGGGTPCFFDNMEWMNAHGLSLYLDTPIPTLLQRAATSRKVRPILANKSESERATFVREQLEHRLPFYTQASLTYSTDTPIEHLLAMIEHAAKQTRP